MEKTGLTDLQKGVEELMVTNVLIPISNWLNAEKSINVTPQELMSCLTSETKDISAGSKITVASNQSGNPAKKRGNKREKYGKCQWIFKRGKNKNNQCPRAVFVPGCIYCTTHALKGVDSKKKNEKVKTVTPPVMATKPRVIQAPRKSSGGRKISASTIPGTKYVKTREGFVMGRVSGSLRCIGVLPEGSANIEDIRPPNEEEKIQAGLLGIKFAETQQPDTQEKVSVVKPKLNPPKQREREVARPGAIKVPLGVGKKNSKGSNKKILLPSVPAGRTKNRIPVLGKKNTKQEEDAKEHSEGDSRSTEEESSTDEGEFPVISYTDDAENLEGVESDSQTENGGNPLAELEQSDTSDEDAVNISDADTGDESQGEGGSEDELQEEITDDRNEVYTAENGEQVPLPLDT